MGIMNELINADVVARLGTQLTTAAPEREFVHLRHAGGELGDLSLRERTDLLSSALLADLPNDYAEVAAIFRRALADDDFAGWAIWPVSETATTLALAASDADASNSDAFEDCLGLMAELTPRLTSEFAIRRLLESDLDRALGIILGWTSHPDDSVRRLASEGTRAFLPWAIRVKAIVAHPESTIPILDALYRDPSEVVRRSVANHLNDLSRLRPDRAVEVAANWMANPDPTTPGVVRHALRTLIKKGHPAALELRGFAPASVTVSAPVLQSDAVSLPGELAFEFTVTNEAAEPALIAVDYLVHFVKSNGLHAAKVFKLTTRELSPGESVTIAKRHAFRQMTTRAHYAGLHALELQINGQRYNRTEFMLSV